MNIANACGLWYTVINNSGENTMLNDDEKKKYISHMGLRCPYCKEKHTVEAGEFYDAQDNFVINKANCTACEKTWKEVYTLSDIIED